MVVDHHFKGSNKEQWDQLLFVLEERDKPTFIVIGFNSYAIQNRVFKKLHQTISKYRFYTLDLSAKQITSLNQAFRSELPLEILNSTPVEYIVDVLGLEKSLFPIDKENTLLSELNFERDVLFQQFPFVTILWTDFSTVRRLKTEARDLWDWISYYYEFDWNPSKRSGKLEGLSPDGGFLPAAEKSPEEISERIRRIEDLHRKYEIVPLAPNLKEREIREKINIQKLLAKEYIALEDYSNAEKAFRIALALSGQTRGLEYEKEEIPSLLNKI